MKAAIAAVLLAVPAMANVQTLTSRSQIQQDDLLDWNSLAAGDSWQAPLSSVSTSSGSVVTVATPEGFVTEPLSNWFGNIAAGPQIAVVDPGPLTLTFSKPLAAAGAEIDSYVYGKFQGIVTAYDANGVELGSAQLPGESANPGEGQSRFLGLRSDTANIQRIVFDSVSDVDQTHGFGISNVSLQYSNVPELTSTVLGGIASVPLILARRRRSARRRRAAI